MFCKNVEPHAKVALTGECADEIFGGYPWFFREDALRSGSFPWSIALDERQTLLNPEIAKKVHIKDYINVLDSKSKRLKVLIEDLFEASKASSGNLELNMEKIDITQTAPTVKRSKAFDVFFHIVQWTWGLSVNIMGGIA